MKPSDRKLALLLAMTLCACGNTTSKGAGASGATTGNGATGGANCTKVVDDVALSGSAGMVPSLVATESGLAAAWLENGEVVVGLSDASGTVSHRTTVSNAAGKAELPSIVVAAGGFIALWSEASSVMGRVLSASLSPAAAPFVVAKTASAEPRPAAVGIGTDAAVTWMSQPTLVAALVGAGTVKQRGTASGWYPAIATDGTKVVLAWSQGGQQGPVHVASLDAMGGGLEVSGSAALIKSVAMAGAKAWVGWEEVGTGSEVIQLAAVDLAAATVSATTTASPAKGSANWPSLAWNGAELAVAYYQFRNGPPSIYLQRFDASLRPIGAEIAIASHAKYPSLAWLDGRWAVAYDHVSGPVSLTSVECR